MRASKLSASLSVLLGIVALGASAPPVDAQVLDTLRYVNRDTLRLIHQDTLLHRLDALPVPAGFSPAISAGSPAAYGLNWGQAFVGAGYTPRARRARNRTGRNADGAAVVAMGFGNAYDAVGLEVAVHSWTTVKGLFDRTGVSFKVHRVFPAAWGVAVGWENAINHGYIDSGPSLYGVVSKGWSLHPWEAYPNLTTTVGVGGGRFRFEEDVFADRQTVNVFGSVGLQPWEPVSLIADWTGQDLVVAMSFLPFHLSPGTPERYRFPLVVTLGAADLTGTAGDGVRFIIGAGVGIQWRSPGRQLP